LQDGRDQLNMVHTGGTSYALQRKPWATRNPSRNRTYDRLTLAQLSRRFYMQSVRAASTYAFA